MHAVTAKDAHDIMDKVLDTCKKEDREGFLIDTIWELLLDIQKDKACLDSFFQEMQDHLEGYTDVTSTSEY